MKVYALLSRLPYPKSYLGKILMVAFVGTHLPLIGLTVYLAMSSAAGSSFVTGVLFVVLAATLVGAVATLYVTYCLLIPVRAASEALRGYRERGRNPELPTSYPDQAGRLMADVQDTADQLDDVIRRLEHASTVDHLTNLPNRVLFSDRLQQALNRARGSSDGLDGESREGDHRRRAYGGPAVLFLDLDDFKMVNDSLGHDAGDHLLAVVAGRLRRCVRPQDTVARFGGDEFTVLLEDAAPQEAIAVAKRIVQTLQRPILVGGQEIVVSCSVGITIADVAREEDSSERGEEEPGALLRKADIALYRAKAGGRGAYVMFEESMDDTAKARFDVESELRRALERGELVLYYQPIANLESGEIAGFETLLRWEHLEQGLLLPEKFIRVAEESGLMVSIGHWVLKEACQQMAEWHRYYPRTQALSVNVNLSASQFERPELVGEVAQVLKETGLDPSILKLEITESVAMGYGESTLEIVRGLRDLGPSIVIDDFGTGYSALGYLTRFPVDELKIDYSIVYGLDQDTKKAAIVQAILTLADSLEYGIVAEGVESRGQLQRLQSLGCKFGQGNMFWEPRTAEAAMELYLQTLEQSPTWLSSKS